MPVISIIYIFMIKRKNAAGPGRQDAGPGGRELWEWNSARSLAGGRGARGRALARQPADPAGEWEGAAARWTP